VTRWRGLSPAERTGLWHMNTSDKLSPSSTRRWSVDLQTAAMQGRKQKKISAAIAGMKMKNSAVAVGTDAAGGRPNIQMLILGSTILKRSAQ